MSVILKTSSPVNAHFVSSLHQFFACLNVRKPCDYKGLRTFLISFCDADYWQTQPQQLIGKLLAVATKL